MFLREKVKKFEKKKKKKGEGPDKIAKILHKNKYL